MIYIELSDGRQLGFFVSEVEAALAGLSMGLGLADFTICQRLTEEQINSQADSLFNAQKEAKLQELRAFCHSGLDAQVNAKVEAMKNPETASN